MQAQGEFTRVGKRAVQPFDTLGQTVLDSKFSSETYPLPAPVNDPRSTAQVFGESTRITAKKNDS